MGAGQDQKRRAQPSAKRLAGVAKHSAAPKKAQKRANPVARSSRGRMASVAPTKIKKTWRDVIDAVDNVPYPPWGSRHDNRGYYAKDFVFLVRDEHHPVGFIPAKLVEKIPWTADFEVDRHASTVTILPRTDPKNKPPRPPSGPFAPEHHHIELRTTQTDLTMAIQRQLKFIEKDNEDGLNGDDLVHAFQHFHPNFDTVGVCGLGEFFEVDRLGAALFGIVTADVYLNCCHTYKDGEGHTKKALWMAIKDDVPNGAPVNGANDRAQSGANGGASDGILNNNGAKEARALTTARLGVAASGFIPARFRPLIAMAMHAQGQLDCEMSWALHNAKYAGCLSTFAVEKGQEAQAEAEAEGLLRPKLRYVFDIEMHNHDEVDQAADNSHVHLEYKDVARAIEEGRVDDGDAVVLFDFFVRHGHITAETVPGIAELANRVHRRLPFPTTPLYDAESEAQQKAKDAGGCAIEPL